MTKVSLVHHVYGEIQLQYAPVSISNNLEGGWTSKPIAGVDDPLRVWSGGGGETFSFQADFVGRRGRQNLRALRGSARRGAWRNAGAPPVWLLYIGARVTPVIVESVHATLEMFDSHMGAGHATADVALARYRTFSVGAS